MLDHQVQEFIELYQTSVSELVIRPVLICRKNANSRCSVALHMFISSLQKAREPSEVKASPEVAISFQLFSTGQERNWTFLTEKSLDLQTK